MSSTIQQEIINRKHFYRDNLRRLSLWLGVSLIIMLLLCLGNVFLRLNQPERSYYATNSAGFITSLASRDKANMRPVALLKPDPPEEVKVKEFNL